MNFDCAVSGGEAPVDVMWTFGEGSQAPIEQASFTYTTPGTYVATCNARDADGDRASASVTVVVGIPNAAPTVVADTLDACAIPTLTPTRLDASASTDPEGKPLFYAWMFVQKPPLSFAQLNDPAIANPSFVPDVAGTYKLRVLVSDQVNVVASTEITIEASGATTVSVVSGSAQTATVARALANDVVAVVRNACGTPVPNAQVAWSGSNATPRDLVDATAADGTAATPVTLGTVAGAATVTATLVVAGASISTATFTFTATPDAPSQLLMDDLSQGVPLSATPIEASVRVTDRFGNAVTTPAVTFTAQFAGLSSATFANGSSCTGGTPTITMTTANGVAKLPLCASVLETVRVRFTAISPATITRSGGHHTFLVDDMERDVPFLTAFTNATNVWKRGTPSFPAGNAATSGTAVFGSRLDGALVPPTTCFGRTTLGRVIDLSYPAQVFDARASFMSRIDLDDNGQCCAAAATMRLDCPSCTPLAPLTKPYNATGCEGRGYQQKNTTYERLAFDLAPALGQQRILVWDVQMGPDVDGGGWYVDDLAITGTVAEPQIKFLPGPPANVVMSTVVDGCKAPSVRGRLFDAFGNFTAVTGTTVTLTATGAATFTSAKTGTGLTGAGTNNATVASVAGVVELALADTAVETATITGTLGTATTQTTVAFTTDECSFFIDDTESGANGWTHQLISSNPGCVTDNWALSTSRAAVGASAWHSGPTQACTGDTRLISPAIDLTAVAAGTPLRLAFQHFFAFDDCSDPTFDPDGAIIEVSVNGGAFNQIAGAYPGTLDFACSNPLQGLPAFTHSSGNTFQDALFDLSQFAGQSIRIGFHVGWDCGNCATPEGWYIDDVRVERGTVPAPFAPLHRPAAEDRAAPYDDACAIDWPTETAELKPVQSGGCSTGGGAGLLVGLLALVRRRRR